MVQILNALFKIVFELVGFLLTGASQLIISTIPTRRNETQNANYLPVSKAMSKEALGFCFGEYKISMEESYQHVAVSGQSGGGKSVCIGLPSLLTITEASIICHDPSGMEFTRSSGAKLSQGFSVRIFNYTDVTKSERYNPMNYCYTKSDTKKLSQILVTASLGDGGSNDKFWNNAAMNLLTLAITWVKNYAPKENRNLANVLVFLKKFAGSPKEIDKLIVLSQDDELLESYKAIIRNDPKVLANITTTALVAMSLWEDPVIGEITSGDTFSFQELRETKTILYIQSDVMQLKYFGCLTSILFEQFFVSMMKCIPTPQDLSVLCVIDEASSLTVSLQAAISNLRKYRVGLLLLYQQAESQLAEQYGIQGSKSILSNSYTRVYLPNQPLFVARELEILFGKFDFVDDAGVQRTKNLANMNEIRMMKESIILIGNAAPIKLELTPYFKQKKLLALSQLPSIEISQKEYPSPYIQITDGED